jgi:lysophospholipase L1-like esterase
VAHKKSEEYRYVRILFLISLGISITLAGVEAFNDLLILKLIFYLVVFTLASLVIMKILEFKHKSTNFFLSLALLNFFIIVPELALRVGGFHYETGINFGYPRPSQFVRLIPDDELFWRLNPSYPNVNTEGFPGDEFTLPKPDDVFRALFLGDSTTVQGYPDEVERIQNEKRERGNRSFESISLAVYGYSSYQGRILAENYLGSLRPDLILVYFGWNDHWLAYGAKDSEKQIDTSSLSEFFVVVQQFRLPQWLFWLSDSLSGVENLPLQEVRVPVEEYRENLALIREASVQEGIPIVFITAPTSHYRLGVPEYLIELKFALSKESVMSLHAEYNDVVRQVAQGEGVFLLDLEAIFDKLTDNELSLIFMEDGIHFTETGIKEVARQVAGFLQANGLADQ